MPCCSPAVHDWGLSLTLTHTQGILQIEFTSVCVASRTRRVERFSQQYPSSVHHLDIQRCLSSLFPRVTLCLTQDQLHLPIPPHSSIKTFWLLTRPRKISDGRCLWEARRRFLRVILSQTTHRDKDGRCCKTSSYERKPRKLPGLFH